MPVFKLDVPGFPGYKAGVNGTVWSAWKLQRRTGGGRGTESYISDQWTQLKPIQRKDGYQRVALRKGGKYHYFLLHQVICMTFHGPCPEGMECLHKDGVKSNCRKENLRWGTRRENVADSIKHGTHQRASAAAAKVNLGRKRTQMERTAISDGLKGHVKSPEHLAKLSGDNHWRRRGILDATTS